MKQQPKMKTKVTITLIFLTNVSFVTEDLAKNKLSTIIIDISIQNKISLIQSSEFWHSNVNSVVKDIQQEKECIVTEIDVNKKTTQKLIRTIIMNNFTQKITNQNWAI